MEDNLKCPTNLDSTNSWYSGRTTTTTNTTVLQISGFCPGQPGVSQYQKKHLPYPLTPIVIINHPFLLTPSITIHSIFPVQFTCLAIFFHNLCPSFLSSSWPGTLHFIHFFTQSLSSLRTTCPYHRNLFCCSTELMSSNPSLSQPFTWKLGTLLA